MDLKEKNEALKEKVTQQEKGDQRVRVEIDMIVKEFKELRKELKAKDEIMMRMQKLGCRVVVTLFCCVLVLC